MIWLALGDDSSTEVGSNSRIMRDRKGLNLNAHPTQIIPVTAVAAAGAKK